ncbi:hypothetical protein [Halorubrum laminariae]|uniref:Helicase HerA central domain-containing protein n=1 Tax=Halorubrum laminariae TaxID=1433523 RepID=A0ABD6BZH7_9EURY|nr:hypothetical protein [Halorubrum laminariae]
MAIKDNIKDNFNDLIGRDTDTDEGGRLDIDSLDGEQLQDAIEYLEAIGRETKRADIEEAAYYLDTVDDDIELFSAFETGEERGRVDRSIVAPNNMERETKWHTRDGDFYQILTTTSLPRLVTPGWLIPVTLSEHDVRLSMHIKPRDTSSVKGRLQQRLTQMKSAIQWKQRRGRTDVYEEEHERKELERLLRNVIEGTTKLFNFSFYMEVHANTLDELEEASRSVQRKVSEQGMDLAPVEGRQIESQQAIAPVGTDPIRNNNTVQLEALATFFNFVEPPVIQPEGVHFGFDDNKRPVIVDRFDLSGYSKVVTGKIGGGKTFSVKMAMYRRQLNDPDIRTIIFDPLGDDFVDFTEKIDGTVIKFGGEDRINPLQIEPPTNNEEATDLYTKKVRSVIEILKTYFDQAERGGMDAGEEGVISQCIHYAYAKKGITADPETFHHESPILDDVIEGVRVVAQGGLNSETSPVNQAMADGAGTLADCPTRTKEIVMDPSDQHIKLAQNLVPKFESFKEGSVNNNLNGHTNIKLDDRTVCFDMEAFADTGEMPLIMHTMLDWAYQEARRSPHRIDITFEEVHYLLDRPGARNLLNLFIRHSRHFDAGLTLISQTPDEFLENDQKREIYDNCDIKQLFYQENVSDRLIDYFDFSSEEARFLRQAARGKNSGFSECLLSTSEHGRRRLEIWTEDFERHMIEETLDIEEYARQQGHEVGPSGKNNDESNFGSSVPTEVSPEQESGPTDGFDGSPPTGPAVDTTEYDHETFEKGQTESPPEPENQEVRDPFRVSKPAGNPEVPSEFEDEQPTDDTPSAPHRDSEASTRPESAVENSAPTTPPGDPFEEGAVEDELNREPSVESSDTDPSTQSESPDARDQIDDDTESEDTLLDRILPNRGGSSDDEEGGISETVDEHESEQEDGQTSPLPAKIEAFADTEFGSWAIKMVPLVIIIIALIALLVL